MNWLEEMHDGFKILGLGIICLFLVIVGLIATCDPNRVYVDCSRADNDAMAKAILECQKTNSLRACTAAMEKVYCETKTIKKDKDRRRR